MKYSKARQSKTKRNLFQNRCLRQILRIRLTDTNEEFIFSHSAKPGRDGIRGLKGGKLVEKKVLSINIKKQ
jgi:hypothetical protein